MILLNSTNGFRLSNKKLYNKIQKIKKKKKEVDQALQQIVKYAGSRRDESFTY
jgi:hypothetical protein